MVKIKTYIFLFFVSIFLISCKKDEKIDVQAPMLSDKKIDVQAPILSGKTTSTVFNFKAFVGASQLVVSSKWYTNANGDSFTVSKFNYYISNIKLKREDGFIFSEVESYHIIKHVEGVTSFTIANLPEGNYNQIEFLIGVDSARNVSGAQTGDLSPDSLMFWEWHSGYIFFKLEGQYKTVISPMANNYAMHIGGFSGTTNYIKKCTFNLINSIKAVQNKSSKFFYNVNVNEIFVNPNLIDFDNYAVGISGRKVHDIADNYVDMFTIDRIEN